jgi:hypothetical protein
LNHVFKSAQVAPGFEPARGLDIISLDTPSDEVIEISSSYDLSVFSSGANSPHAEGVGATPAGSRPSIRELWSNIDKLDEINHEDTSVVHIRELVLRDSESLVLTKKTNKRARRRGGEALQSDAPGPSSAVSKGRGKGASQILSAAPEAISPCMWRSFVDRQYSPLTGMDRREWEIILDQLIHMGYIVKKEPDSDGNG